MVDELPCHHCVQVNLIPWAYLEHAFYTGRNTANP